MIKIFINCFIKYFKSCVSMCLTYNKQVNQMHKAYNQWRKEAIEKEKRFRRLIGYK